MTTNEIIAMATEAGLNSYRIAPGEAVAAWERFAALVADSVLEDAARLDFIERHPEMSLRHHKGRWAFLGFTNYEYDLHQSLREAIDAAMAAQGGK